MQLSLSKKLSLQTVTFRNWHPLASHGVFFLLGFVFNEGTGTSRLPQEKPLLVRQGKTQLALTPSILGSSPDSSLQPRMPVAIAKYSVTTHQALCRLPPDFVILQQLVPFPVVELPTAELKHWFEFFSDSDKRSYRLYPLGKLGNVSLCNVPRGPKVSYGPLF